MQVQPSLISEQKQGKNDGYALKDFSEVGFAKTHQKFA